jgi:hypothetical protein
MNIQSEYRRIAASSPNFRGQIVKKKVSRICLCRSTAAMTSTTIVDIAVMMMADLPKREISN